LRRAGAIVLAGIVLVLIAAVAWGQEHGTPATASGAAPGNDLWVKAILGLSAAMAVGTAAIASGWAQSKIGSAAAGAIAEKPEVGGMMIVLEAIPETMIILGFVIAIMIVGKI
jgi:V/A-type H+-transporting ATPase subunit K